MCRPFLTLLLTTVSALAAAGPATASVMNVTFLANSFQVAASASAGPPGSIASASVSAGVAGVNVGVQSPPGFFDLGIGGGLDIGILALGSTEGAAKATAAGSAGADIRVINANPFAVLAGFQFDLAYYLNAFVDITFAGPTAVPTMVTLTATVTDPMAGTLYSTVVPVVGPNQTATAATVFPFVVPLAGGQTRDLTFLLDISGSTTGSALDSTSFVGSLTAAGNDRARFNVRITGVTEAVVPEPATLATLGVLAAGLAVRRRYTR